MKRLLYTTLATGLTIALSGTPVAAQDPAPPPESGMSMPQAAGNDPIANEGVIDDVAVDALKEMSNFLMSAKTLGIVSEGSLDVVTNDGQRIQLDGVTTYKVRKPGFVIDYASDIKSRRFIYDGKTFTVYSPKLGFYASVPAPGTNKEVLDTIYQKFGISLPLEDLFRWGDSGANADRVKALKSAYQVGTATIDGVETDHYAFREEDVDWEVWIQSSGDPLPKKLVIVDRSDPARPTFTSRLKWQINPAYSDADFAFTPDANAKKIQLATYKGE
ncbi:DUF2092 domain-containing protein [Sphingomonas sp. SM33]|uniref:DUF2092 domain-containing protein n=1 Tax=Sphingomonas telluris TaxID=2907998 RepID=A0ABS9VQ08_9SPHN|nr:DUF2092 domain-containing protein [Sphingomonas telluris]MCH8616599.1 DUF2092 domain-containing protein [Sphingomonas telluris]